MSQADAGRIIHIGKRRERAKEDIESQRQRLEEERRNLANSIKTKFTTNVDEQEEKFKARTVGLVTLDEMSQADAGRIIHIGKRRERAKEDIESQRQRLEEERRNLANSIKTKFTTNVDEQEEKFKARTVGLVTLDEVKERQNEFFYGSDPSLKFASEGRPKFERAVQKRVLSFGAFDDDEEEDEELIPITKKRLGMDPTVDTSFLPDRERDDQLQRERERIAREWQEMQEKEKNEEIMVAFCYWDGSSHRKDSKTKKGATIAQFLQKALDRFRKEFLELKLATVDNLMFVKEDLIIPHFYT
uniref:Protein FAM50 homolog n=1 Tax=Globodera pallida TaxID=36090 RepID=A0A183BMR7_GLOPA